MDLFEICKVDMICDRFHAQRLIL